jgi:N6-adenosine-specific RNA methylase IME4
VTDQLFEVQATSVVPVEPGPLPAGPYDVIYADPPWRYANQAPRSQDRIESYYPTMPIEDIRAIPVENLAASDAALFLWATSPLLPEALSVMTAWGFTYKTSMAWDKGRMGLGYWVRVQHELLLIGSRGNPGRPLTRNICSVISEPRGPHSRKPDRARRNIEAMFPTARRIELFARMRTPGWDAWGNEA